MPFNRPRVCITYNQVLSELDKAMLCRCPSSFPLSSQGSRRQQVSEEYPFSSVVPQSVVCESLAEARSGEACVRIYCDAYCGKCQVAVGTMVTAALRSALQV